MPARDPAARKSAAKTSGRFAYEGLDRIFHEKARLGIMTSLTTQPEPLSFGELAALCALSDGNLNRHLAVLSEAGFVKVTREGRGRASRTLCAVTRAGQKAFLEYLKELERVIADAVEASAVREHHAVRPGWATA